MDRTFFVLSQLMHHTCDKRTDGQMDEFTIAKTMPAHCSTVKILKHKHVADSKQQHEAVMHL